jgi:hypothetical protein
MACAIVAREAAKQRHSHRGTIFLALVLDAYSDDRVLPECCTNSSLQTSQSEDADQKMERLFQPGKAAMRVLGDNSNLPVEPKADFSGMSASATGAAERRACLADPSPAFPSGSM